MMLHHRLLGLTRGVRWYLLLLILLGLGIVATYVGQGILAALTIAAIFAGQSWLDLLPLLASIIALLLLRAMFLWLREIGAIWTALAVKRKVRAYLYQHLLTLGPGYLEHVRTGKVQSTLVDGVEALEGYMGYYIPQAFVALLAPLLITGYLFLLDPVVGIVVFICVLLVPTVPAFWDRLLGSYGKSHWQAYGELNAQFVDNMQGMTTLKAFNASVRRGQELQREASSLYRATMKQLSISMIRTGIVGLAMTGGIALATILGALHLAEGTLALSSLFVILFLAGECFRPLNELSAYWHQGYMGISASSGIFELLDRSPDILEPAQPVSVHKTQINPDITFEDVSFAYAGGTRPALNTLSFAIKAGETVALVGRSGAGKTTVVSLLFRFFEPQSGTIMLDGRDLSAYNSDLLRSMMTVVSQDTYLFHGTVAENLRLGKSDATSQELQQAAQAANAHDFITALPQGYDTIIGERGLKLSGGERQRIAIARALLKDAPILILDEATSAVDAANEAEIQQSLERLTMNRTTLVIAHRLSTVIRADRILVLDNGQVIEHGHHTELLARQGAYTQLVAAQHGG